MKTMLVDWHKVKVQDEIIKEMEKSLNEQIAWIKEGRPDRTDNQGNQTTYILESYTENELEDFKMFLKSFEAFAATGAKNG